MWRPDGWENGYSGFIAQQAFEAGADAMLEILRDSGIRTNSFRTNSNVIYLSNPRQNGVYVFIPEK